MNMENQTISVVNTSEAAAKTSSLDGSSSSELVLPIMTRDDVQAAFRLFLGREPKSEEEIMPYVGVTSDRILLDFMLSAEFIARKEMAGPLVFIAKKIVETQQTANNAQDSS